MFSAALACACALLLSALPAAAAAPVPDGWDPERFISTAELEPGMTGIGYTVFQGVEIETFDVEIIGVLYDMAPGRDAIIARMSGRVVDVAGIIQGMSGSPVYIDGRLAGAVAFGWSFMAEPICGITPIQHMLPFMGQPGAQPQDMAAADGGGTEPLRLTAEQVSGMPGFPVQGDVQLAPLATPIMVSGLSPEFIEEIRPWFESVGLVPMVGGGGTHDFGDVDPELEPGSALAVTLVQGDLNMAGIGTVTYVEDGAVIGFGHAFRYAGPVALPMGNAVIVGVLPSQRISSKIGIGLRTLGTLTQDRQTAVAGNLGEGPPMVPIHVSVVAPEQDTAREFNYEVAPDRELMPSMLAVTSAASVQEMVRAAASYHAQVDLTIRLWDHDPITTRAYLTNRSSAATPVGLTVMRYAKALLDNPYGRLGLESVDLAVTVRPGYAAVYLEEVRPAYLTVRPGESLPVSVVYRRHEGAREQATATIQIPETVRDGTYTLIVSDARRTRLLESRRAPMRFRPTTVEQYLDLLDLDYPANELTFTLLSSQPGMAVHGEEMALLPGSVMNVLRSAAARDLAQPTRGTVVAQTALSLDAAISGATMLRIRVDRHAP